MAALPERRVSPSAQWARSVARFSLVLLAVACLAHRYGLLETVPFIGVMGVVAVAAVAGLVLSAIGFSRLWYRGDKAGRASLAAAIMALIALAPFAAAAYLTTRYPMLHDISTDLMEPPSFSAATPARTGWMNPIVPISTEQAEEQLEAYPALAGRRIEASMERTLSAVRAVIAARGWTPYRPIPQQAEGEIVIEMLAPTAGLRFPTDAVLRLYDEGESVFVDMRINSRYGSHDLGDGARRIGRFMADLEAEFNRQSLEIIDIPALPGEEDPVQ